MSIVQQVSQQLLAVFSAIVPPPAQWPSCAKKTKLDDIGRSLDRLHEKARELRREYRLGILARARVILVLQREFSRAGYPPDLSRQILFALVVSAFVGKV